MATQGTTSRRVVRDYLSSSLVWNDFLAQGGFVPRDIVVVDPFKAGTTWTQRIIQQILSNGEEPGEDCRTSRRGWTRASAIMRRC